jgi:hypothetical protein
MLTLKGSVEGDAMSLHILAGVIAPLIVLVSESIYIFSIFHPSLQTGAHTRPSRSTFWIWTLVQALLALSYFQAGGGMAASLSLAYATAFLIIAVLSFRFGYSRWDRLDTTCLLGALVSAGLWALTLYGFDWRPEMSALLATFLLLTTDFLGAIPTLKKARTDPFTEERVAWLLTCVATVVNFFAITDWTIADFLYTPYLLVVNGLITYFLWQPVIKN